MVSAITPPCPTQSGIPLHGRSSDLRFALLSEPSHPGKVVELTIQGLNLPNQDNLYPAPQKFLNS